MTILFKNPFERIIMEEKIPNWAWGLLVFIAMNLWTFVQGAIKKWVSNSETQDNTLSSKIDTLTNLITDLKMTIIKSVSKQERNTADIAELKKEIQYLKREVLNNSANLKAKQ